MTRNTFGKALIEKDFYRFLVEHYEHSVYERTGLEDSRFKKNTYLTYLCKTRCFMVYKEIVERLTIGSKVIDLGFYPGTLIRELKALLKNNILCYGAGLHVDSDFKSFMEPYVEGINDIELDPFYQKSNKNVRISYENGFFDAVIATELIEHLISPLEMISESARILKAGGIFIMTTPNVSHIGAVAKLILGRSNHERIDSSPMYHKNNEWRGHIRFYDKRELKTLFERSGLDLISHIYYRELGWNHAISPLHKKMIIGIVDKIAPIYRESHFAIFQKNSHG